MSAIITGPQGCGKTRNAHLLARFLGLTKVIDGYQRGTKLADNELALTNEDLPEALQYHVVMQAMHYLSKFKNGSIYLARDLSPNPPHNVMGFYLETADGGRIGQTFVNCRYNKKQAGERAVLWAASADLLIALKKARHFVESFSGGNADTGVNDLLGEIDMAIMQAEEI